MTILYSIITESFQKNFFDEYLAKLPPFFVEKIRKFRRWQDAQASLLGKLLISEVLTDGDLSILNHIQFNTYGRPFIKNYPDFNISHSGNYVVLVMDNSSRVGIDIEEIKPTEPLEFKSQMTNFEWESITQSKNKLHAFYLYWTQKESVIKAYGKGLSSPLSSFEIRNGLCLLDQNLFYVDEVNLVPEIVCFVASDREIKNIPVKKVINF